MKQESLVVTLLLCNSFENSFDTVGIWIMNLSGIQVMNICPIIEWSVIQIVFWKADKIVCYSDHGLTNGQYRASEYQTKWSTIQMVSEYRTIVSTIKMPFEYWTITGHLNSEQVKVHYFRCFCFQMFAIQIPTVLES